MGGHNRTYISPLKDYNINELQIPFDSFFITNRGYMQDHQMSFSRQAVTTMGLLLADRTNGPFSLEIQHIKAVRILFHQPKSHLIL
jgi:hypothetical protein